MKREAVAKLINTDSNVPTVSGTMEGDVLSNSPLHVHMRNCDHYTCSNAHGPISDLGDSSTSLCNSSENGGRPRRNSNVSNSATGDTDISDLRARYNTEVITTENRVNSRDSGIDSIVEDAFQERLVLLQRTAIQGHEGSGFFLRLGCLREYEIDILLD